jgi:hypothetical protein
LPSLLAINPEGSSVKALAMNHEEVTNPTSIDAEFIWLAKMGKKALDKPLLSIIEKPIARSPK